MTSNDRTSRPRARQAKRAVIRVRPHRAEERRRDAGVAERAVERRGRRRVESVARADAAAAAAASVAVPAASSAASRRVLRAGLGAAERVVAATEHRAERAARVKRSVVVAVEVERVVHLQGTQICIFFFTTRPAVDANFIPGGRSKEQKETARNGKKRQDKQVRIRTMSWWSRFAAASRTAGRCDASAATISASAVGEPSSAAAPPSGSSASASTRETTRTRARQFVPLSGCDAGAILYAGGGGHHAAAHCRGVR